MANSGGGTQGAISLDPQHAQRLYQAVPDLDDWPRSWHVDPADIPVGQQIVQVLTPFLLQLLDQGLAKTTLRRHRDNPARRLIQHDYLRARMQNLGQREFLLVATGK